MWYGRGLEIWISDVQIEKKWNKKFQILLAISIWKEQLLLRNVLIANKKQEDVVL